MVMQINKWLGGRSDVAIRAAFSFAMCGALAGLLYLTARDGLADGSSAQQAPQAATVLASLDTRPQADRLPPTDIHPISVAIPLDVTPSITASAGMKSVIPTKRPAVPTRSAVEKDAVARFDRCLPDCETHDPMIVGYADKTPAIEPGLRQDDQEIEQAVSLPVLSGPITLLGKALDVPGAAFRKGRSVISTVVRATL